MRQYAISLSILVGCGGIVWAVSHGFSRVADALAGAGVHALSEPKVRALPTPEPGGSSGPTSDDRSAAKQALIKQDEELGFSQRALSALSAERPMYAKCWKSLAPGHTVSFQVHLDLDAAGVETKRMFTAADPAGNDLLPCVRGVRAEPVRVTKPLGRPLSLTLPFSFRL